MTENVLFYLKKKQLFTLRSVSQNGPIKRSVLAGLESPSATILATETLIWAVLVDAGD